MFKLIVFLDDWVVYNTCEIIRLQSLSILENDECADTGSY